MRPGREATSFRELSSFTVLESFDMLFVVSGFVINSLFFVLTHPSVNGSTVEHNAERSGTQHPEDAEK